jgi:hypothetical protein
MTSWHTQTVESVLRELNVDPDRGLSDDEAARRREQVGPNELIERGGKHPLRILWQQFTSTMVLILIVAAVVSGLLGKATETIAIAAIVVLFGILGFVQEYRAEQAMAALKKLAVPIVRVVRGGDRREISARELVPGDRGLAGGGQRRAGRRAPGGERQPAHPGVGADRRVGGGGEVDRRAGNGVAAAGRPRQPGLHGHGRHLRPRHGRRRRHGHGDRTGPNRHPHPGRGRVIDPASSGGSTASASCWRWSAWSSPGWSCSSGSL